MSSLCSNWRSRGLNVGFVPTMGALHAGHLKLVELAGRHSDRVVVSIFVNPTQFGEGEDLDSYPRVLSKDCSLLDELGAAAVFTPVPEVVYPVGFSTEIRLAGLTRGLCGKFRPDHFAGVATVVAVLFGIIKPDIAVFGEKDYQQLSVLRRMNADLRLGVNILSAPIVREADGLAMSSRNAYLSVDEREQATAVRRGLLAAAELARGGEKECSELKQAFREEVEKMPLLKIQYVDAVDPFTMEKVETVKEKVLLAAAVFAGKTRLIDNVIIEPEV